MKFDKPIRRLAPAVEAWPTQTADENTFKFIFSDETIGRDRFIVLNKAIKHENYDRNNVILFAHDDKQPVIGRGTNIDTSKTNCSLNISFVPREILPFAGVIRDLVAGKWMRAVSLSWDPIEYYKPPNDPDVIAIFTEVDMLEVSVVPLPALPGALLDARSHGVDTAPMYEWAERLLDMGETTVIQRGELEELRRAAKMPAKANRTDDPKPTVAAAVTDDPQTPAGAVFDDKTGIGNNVDKERALKTKRAFVRSSAEPVFKRGLYDAGRLCFLLEELGYAHFSAAFEAEMEGDGSTVPAMLKDILDSLGKACIEMTAEEVNEFLAMHGTDDDEDEADAESRAMTPNARAFIAEAKNPRARALRRGIAVARAGKELSVSNRDHLEAAQDHHERALKHHADLGEHNESVGTHVDAAQAACDRATQTLAELGEHVRAAKEDPGKSADHLEAAEKAHGETEKHMGAVEKSHENAKDSHADADDSHRALGRRVKAARRCVRSVLSGAVTSEADDTGADDVQKQQQAEEEKARAARAVRAARAAALQPRKEPVTLTLD